MGCGYFVKLTVLISSLMIANSYIVRVIVQMNVQSLPVPGLMDDVRVYQFFQIFVPILLVCLQFWIYDRLKDYWLQRQSNQ